MKFLCASDLHLGRRAVGIPDHLGLDPGRFATSAVWDLAVELALRERVDLVLLAGDIVDRENRLYEALGPLERGVNTLGRHGIAVYAVAGEDDFDTLRRVADNDDGDTLTLLGRDGHWQRLTVERDGRAALRLAGWSAPGQRFHGSVLAGFAEGATDERADASAPLVAMFHGTVSDQPRAATDFAAVEQKQLDGQEASLWIAGHEHTPRFAPNDDGTGLLVPGAICPLHAAETGPHGVWVVEVAPETPVSAHLVALAPIRFEAVRVDLSDVVEPADVEAVLIRALHDALAAALREDPHGNLLCVSCRVHLAGQTRLHGDVPTIVQDLARTLDIQERGVVAAIGDVVVETRPPLDLDLLVRRPDSVGEIARLLAALDADDPAELSDAQRELVGRGVTRLQAIHRARVFAAVAGDREPDAEDAKRELRRQGWDVLAGLIQQREVE